MGADRVGDSVTEADRPLVVGLDLVAGQASKNARRFVGLVLLAIVRESVAGYQ